VAAKPAEIDRAARMPPSVKLLDNGGGDRDRLVCACGVKAEDRSVCVNLAVIRAALRIKPQRAGHLVPGSLASHQNPVCWNVVMPSAP
jgi:hypothetical protein